MEEITEFDYEDFEQFDLRLRGEAGETRQLFASFNPINEEHWVKKELFDKPLKNGKYVHTTYKDNQHIDQREYEEKLNRMSPHNQRIYKEGKWGLLRTGMEFYPAFDAMVHVSDKALYEPDSAIHLTFDMNVNPYMTLLVNQIRFMPETKRVRVTQIDEICLPHPLNKTRYVCERFMRDYADHNAGLFYYGDATSKKGNTMTEDEVKHDYDIVENVCRRKLNNGSFRVNKANPPVLKRKDFMDDLFRGNTAIDYLIHPKCKNTINDYLYLKEGADGKKFKEKEENKITGAKFEKYGHCSDAEEYFFCYAFENIMRQYERR
jgi:PBSX family phage terminase large subunit